MGGRTLGVLAIQGDFAAHARALRRVGAAVIEVRRTDDLRGVEGLIIPGGESTTMLKFIAEETSPTLSLLSHAKVSRSSEHARERFCLPAT